MDDELLQDLEKLGEEEGGVDGEGRTDALSLYNHGVDLLSNAELVGDIDSIAKILHSGSCKSTLAKINGYLSNNGNVAPLSDEEEHKLIVETNRLASEIDTEILITHKVGMICVHNSSNSVLTIHRVSEFIKSIYSKSFPELESLIVNPLDYARTVKVIGRHSEIPESELKEFLSPAAAMVVTVASTTTEGKKLSEEEICGVEKACDVMTELDIAKRNIFNFLELKMNKIAPNLSALLNSSISAKLIVLAGGLSALANIPACDILVLGRSKNATMGFSLVGFHVHRGLVYFSDLVASVPEVYRRKAARALAAKVCLAARIDLNKSSPDGSKGRAYREYVQKHIDMILQPPVIKAVKPLPVPEDGPRRRRAGRRFRSMKQRVQLSELSKAQNRVTFGVPEKEVGFELGETKGLGMLGAQLGKIRSYQADTRFKMPLSKKHRALNNAISNTSGVSSSAAFTPVKGIELENPELQEKRKTQAVENRLFSSTVFTKVMEQKKAEGGGR